MFKKPNLKNRFNSVETLLKAEIAKVESIENVLPTSNHPQIQMLAKTALSSDEQDLNYYLRLVKNTFKRLTIPALSAEELESEELVSKAINIFTRQPCLIEIHHSNEMRAAKSLNTFVQSLKEYPQAWKAVLRELTWISFSYQANSMVVTFSDHSLEAQLLERVLNSISMKSGSLVSFHIRHQNNCHQIHLRLDASSFKKMSNEREVNL
jgi:hypothetical protein